MPFKNRSTMYTVMLLSSMQLENVRARNAFPDSHVGMMHPFDRSGAAPSNATCIRSAAQTLNRVSGEHVLPTQSARHRWGIGRHRGTLFPEGAD